MERQTTVRRSIGAERERQVSLGEPHRRHGVPVVGPEGLDFTMLPQGLEPAFAWADEDRVPLVGLELAVRHALVPGNVDETYPARRRDSHLP